MENNLMPAALPDEVNKSESAPIIYQQTIWIIGAILALLVIGIFVMIGLGKPVPEYLNAVIIILATGLVGLITGESRKV